jgi:hypothetical protein
MTFIINIPYRPNVPLASLIFFRGFEVFLNLQINTILFVRYACIVAIFSAFSFKPCLPAVALA